MTNLAKKIVNTLAAIGLGLAVTNVNPVKAAQLNISGDSNIFGAGKIPLFCHSGKIKIRSKFLTVDIASI